MKAKSIYGSSSMAAIWKYNLALVSGLAVLACAGDALGQSGARIVRGSEVLITRNENFAHVETMLAVNPADPKHLLVSCIILPKKKTGGFLFGCRAYVSRDAGKSWKASLLPEEEFWDPVVTFTPRGTALFVCLGKRLAVFRSEDGGTHWKDRRELPFTDHEMIAVDWTSSERRGHIYLSGRGGDEATDSVVAYRSVDDGRAFESAIALEKPHSGQAESLLVLRDGTVVLAVTSETNTLQALSCLRSFDGGKTFTQPSRIATRSFNLKGHHGDNAPAFALGTHAGKERLYAVYSLCRGDANARLLMQYSDDAGQTWSQAKNIVESTAAPLTHGACNVSVNAAGTVGVSWLQRKIRSARQQTYKEGDEVVWDFNETYDLFFTVSLDGADTFLSPVKITSKSSKPRSKHASRFWPGTDYMLAAAASDGTFHLLWPDARSGIFQLYTCAVRVE